MPKGRKNCPTCGEEVACRSLTCKCGYSFIHKMITEKPAQKPQVAEPEKEPEPFRFPVIYAPLKPYPIEPASDSPTQENVEAWIRDLESYAASMGFEYDPTAIRYMAAHEFWLYPGYSKEQDEAFLKVERIIKNYYGADYRRKPIV
jgi:hypothetical protein